MDEVTLAGLARAGGVGVETVRYYQRRGLLPAPSLAATDGGSKGLRRYGEGEVRRLRFIRSAQAAGFTLAEVGELLALDATEDRDRARALARARVSALNVKIAELETARDSLHHLAEECGATSAGPCPIIAAFDKG